MVAGLDEIDGRLTRRCRGLEAATACKGAEKRCEGNDGHGSRWAGLAAGQIRARAERRRQEREATRAYWCDGGMGRSSRQWAYLFLVEKHTSSGLEARRCWCAQWWQRCR
ncbi:hypothetical protein M0R45_016610 [Rubus argutus]|uniref:Uncharacterized protein n=1 Tax=Rubus argutus TaxID=59490 RepID=A0AAW1XVI5_RUBAR